MPVTAKLSRKFYETFGDEIANELVEWFNLVDATYRSDLRDLNELNFQRFDAKVEQRFAEFSASVDQRFAEFSASVDQRFAEFSASVDQRFVELSASVDRRFEQLDERMAQQRVEMAHQRTDLIKWMFVFWVGNVAATAGIVLAVVKILP